MQIDEKTFVVDSLISLTAFCAFVKTLFGKGQYLTFTWRLGADRSIDQNAKMWPMLTDISKQVVWFGKKHSKDAWKEIITGSWKQCEFVPNIAGTGFVIVGLSTKKLPRKEFSELIEYIYAFGADEGVVWSERSKDVYAENRRK